jgi:methyl-accepting chemotaxis protein
MFLLKFMGTWWNDVLEDKVDENTEAVNETNEKLDRVIELLEELNDQVSEQREELDGYTEVLIETLDAQETKLNSVVRILPKILRRKFTKTSRLSA